jgi:CheY-like chemotaxis protein
MRDVLVVDDDAVVRQTLAAVLSRAGFSAQVAGNAYEALMELRVRSFHVILSDVQMPYVEGTTFYHQVVSEFPELAKRVVFVTGSVTPAVVSAETGRPCLTKPVDANEILRVVKTVAEGGDDQ